MTEKSLFGRTPGGEAVYSYKITNAEGESVTILSLGATVHSLLVKDGDGSLCDVVLGCRTVAEYETGDAYFGALVGRVANRISGCGMLIDGQKYTFPDTGGGVTLHGGSRGFNLKLFEAREYDPAASTLTLETTSPDGDQGFPGKLSLSVSYTFTDTGALIMEYSAVSDAKTPVNLTNHTYFNLCGEASGKNVYDTQLKLAAGRITPLGGDFTPTGELLPVGGTVFDFRRGKAIGADLDRDDPQLALAGGYDVNYVLDRVPDGLTDGSADGVPGGFTGGSADGAPGGFTGGLTGGSADGAPGGFTGGSAGCDSSASAWEYFCGGRAPLPLVASAFSPGSGIALYVFTDRPCMQFYSGNFLTDFKGKSGVVYSRRYGFCLETQGYPDAENKNLPGNILAPGEEFKSTTVYAFGRRA